MLLLVLIIMSESFKMVLIPIRNIYLKHFIESIYQSQLLELFSTMFHGFQFTEVLTHFIGFQFNA